MEYMIDLQDGHYAILRGSSHFLWRQLMSAHILRAPQCQITDSAGLVKPGTHDSSVVSLFSAGGYVHPYPCTEQGVCGTWRSAPDLIPDWDEALNFMHTRY